MATANTTHTAPRCFLTRPARLALLEALRTERETTTDPARRATLQAAIVALTATAMQRGCLPITLPAEL